MQVFICSSFVNPSYYLITLIHNSLFVFIQWLEVLVIGCIKRNLDVILVFLYTIFSSAPSLTIIM